MNFRELLQFLERRLGCHQLPLNRAATGLKDLFDGIPLHNELMRKLVRAIFEANGCRALTDPVQRQETLNAIGPIRLETLRCASTDVDVYRLLDELCVATAAAFTDDARRTGAAEDRTPHATAGQPVRASAQIIPFDFSRRRTRIKASRA
jgi:hypothetical protein